ncbi:hypothetical protein M2256_002501 [Lactococcus lactis]|uniref:Uncharacterized protein n=1 Tax=Lactococcus lactis TaxID=1358 RepID=A0AAW5TWJ6_9LACT|nr:hypothetical protein [Lactococcus lactis]
MDNSKLFGEAANEEQLLKNDIVSIVVKTWIFITM